jgi:hypothetical protein
MPNFSGVWSLRQQGVAVQGDIWQKPATEGRAIFTGGTTSGYLSHAASLTVLDFVEINTLSNASNFGDLSTGSSFNGCMSSSTRGVIQLGGDTAASFNRDAATDTIEYVTIASEGNSSNFGDASQKRYNGIMSASNATRGINGGGYVDTYSKQIDYITIATQGDGQDFGDLSVERWGPGGLGSSTRSICLGGISFDQNTERGSNHIDYRAIASLGDFVDFGDLNELRRGMSAASNSTRGIVSGSMPASEAVDSIEYITIATLGNGTDFGDLANPSNMGCGAAGESRAVLVRGNDGSSTYGNETSDIEYITIATLSNGRDFGDLTVARQAFMGQSIASNHGGLQT